MRFSFISPSLILYVGFLFDLPHSVSSGLNAFHIWKPILHKTMASFTHILENKRATVRIF